MPRLSMSRMADTVMRSFTQRLSLPSQKRFTCRLGSGELDGLAVRVGNLVAAHRALSADLTHLGHGALQQSLGRARRGPDLWLLAGFGQGDPGDSSTIPRIRCPKTTGLTFSCRPVGCCGCSAARPAPR
jgi:hypothetical protein